jgi:hypothetical protein
MHNQTSGTISVTDERLRKLVVGVMKVIPVLGT